MEKYVGLLGSTIERLIACTPDVKRMQGLNSRHLLVQEMSEKARKNFCQTWGREYRLPLGEDWGFHGSRMEPAPCIRITGGIRGGSISGDARRIHYP